MRTQSAEEGIHMINVDFTYENGVRTLECVGHAEYGGCGGASGGCGGDVVCAAASALTGALAAAIFRREGEFASASVTEADGYCRVSCAEPGAAPFFEFALVGLTKLAGAFPANVAVSGFDESEVFV